METVWVVQDKNGLIAICKTMEIARKEKEGYKERNPGSKPFIAPFAVIDA